MIEWSKPIFWRATECRYHIGVSEIIFAFEWWGFGAGWFLSGCVWAGVISGCEILTGVGSAGYGGFCGTHLEFP
jgi:hypothetical protein